MALEEPLLRIKVFRGLLWLGTSTFIVQLISWLSTIFVIRLLSPSEFGLMAMTAGFVSLLTMVSELGVSSALIQARELTEREIRQTFAWVLITGLVGLAASFASAPWVADFYDVPDLVWMIRILAVNMVMVMVYVIPQSLFVREMNFKVKAQIEMFAQLGATLLTLILALNEMGVWALIAGQIVLYSIKALAFNIARPHWITPLFDLRGSRKLLQYGLTVTGDRMLNFIHTESDTIIIGKFLGGAALGGYAVARSLASIPMEKVLPIITQVSFTSYARIQDDLGRVRKNILRTARTIAFAGVPIFFGMSVLAPLALPLVLGPKWESLIVPFQLLCLILPLKALSSILPPAIFALGQPSVNLVNMMITSTTMALAFFVGVWMGVLGICVAWLVVYPVVFAITTIRSLRMLDIPAVDYLAEIRFPFFAGVFMLISVEVVRRVIVMPQPLYSLMFLTLFGFIVYLTLTVILNRDQYAEIRAYLQR